MCPSSTTSSEAGDGLIPVLDRAGSRRPAPALVGLVLGLAGILVFGRAAVDALWPAEVPEIIGTERAADEARRAAASFWDGSLAAWAGQHLRLSSRVRQATAPAYARALYRVFDEIHPSVVAGPDGWLFKADRLSPVPEPEERLLGRSAAPLAAIHRRVRAYGVEVRVLLVPRKSDVYAEWLPRGIDARTDLYEKLRRAIEGHGVRTPDLLGPFRTRRAQDLWHRADTHWSDEGMRLAADIIARDAGAPPKDAPRATRIIEGASEPEPADLYRLAGLPCGDGPVPRSPDRNHRPLSVIDAGGQPLPFIFGADPTPAPIVLTGTSFTAGRNLPRFLAHESGAAVRTDAWPAEGPGEPIRRSLHGIVARGALPELLIWEIPSYALLCHYGSLEGLGQALADVPAPHLTPVAEIIGAELAGIFPGDAPLRPGRLETGAAPLATWARKGVVHHDAAGMVSARLRGRVTGGPVRVRVGSESLWIEAVWAAPRTEIVLPVLGVRGESYAFAEIRGAGAPATVELESIHLVTDLDAGGGADARPAGIRDDAGVRIAELVFDDAPVIERDAGILLSWTGGDGAPATRTPATPIEVEVRIEGRKPDVLRRTLATAAGPGGAILGLTPAEGARILGVSIRRQRGPDPMPDIAARLLPQKKVR